MLIANLICVVNVIPRATLILTHHACGLILTACNCALHLSHSLNLLRRVGLVKVSDRMRTFLSRLHQSLHCLAYVVFVTFDLIIHIIIFIAHIVNIFDCRALILLKIVQICCRRHLFTLTLIQLEGLSVRDNFSRCTVILVGWWAASLQSWRSRWRT